MLVPLQKRESDGRKSLLRSMHLLWSGRLSCKYLEQHGRGAPINDYTAWHTLGEARCTNTYLAS